MKILCETTGSFQLLDPNTGLTIRHDRPSVSPNTGFLSARAAIGQVRVLANVTDEATDEEFAKYYSESGNDTELAVDSFLSAYEVSSTSSKRQMKATEPKPEPEPEVKKAPGRPKKTEAAPRLELAGAVNVNDL